MLPPVYGIQEAICKVCLCFEIPDCLTGKRIIYSEIMLPFQITRFRDTTFSVDVYALTSPWSEDSLSWEFPWQNEGGDMDSLSVFRRYITLGDNDTHALDLTQLVRDWVYEDRVNHGFAIAINFPDRRGLRFNIDRLLPYIRNRLSLEVIISP